MRHRGAGAAGGVGVGVGVALGSTCCKYGPRVVLHHGRRECGWFASIKFAGCPDLIPVGVLTCPSCFAVLCCAVPCSYDWPWWMKLQNTKLKDGKLQLGELTGGKMDDITVLMAVVEEAELSVLDVEATAAAAAAAAKVSSSSGATYSRMEPNTNGSSNGNGNGSAALA